jgi:hypothetical protein
MKCLSLMFVGVLFINSTDLWAQKKNFQLGGIAEVGFPNDAYETGFGGFVKGGVHINPNAQLTLQTGLSRFRSAVTFVDINGNATNDKASLRSIPVLIGYKYHFKPFYLEPQVGYGALSSKINYQDSEVKSSKGAFYYSIGAGYQINNLNIGLRYQGARESGRIISPILGNRQFSYFGVHLGYIFTLSN